MIRSNFSIFQLPNCIAFVELVRKYYINHMLVDI